MPRRPFTDEDRARALAVRKRNRERKRDYVKTFTDCALPSELVLGYLVSVVQNEDASTSDRIRAAQTALPYVEQKLRSRDAESQGQDPINLNALMMEALEETHGDPWREAENGSSDGAVPTTDASTD